MRSLAAGLLFAALTAGVGAAPAAAQAKGPRTDTAKLASIRALLAAQHTDSLMLMGVEQAFANQKPDPNLPAGFLDSVRVRIRRDIGVFVERLVPIYDSFYTAGEINALMQFYRTPTGQKLLATQGQLAQATAQLGQRWGMEVAAQVLMDMARQPAPGKGSNQP